MTLYELHYRDHVAQRMYALLQGVEDAAKDAGVECTLLLSAATMLLCQTTDAARKPTCRKGDTRAAVKKQNALRVRGGKKLFMLCTPSSQRPLKLMDSSFDLTLLLNAAHKHVAEYRHPEEVLLGQTRPASIEAARETSLFKYVTHLRNAIGHGNVWWGPPQRQLPPNHPDPAGQQAKPAVTPVESTTCDTDRTAPSVIERIFFASTDDPNQGCRRCYTAMCENGNLDWMLSSITVDGFRDFLMWWCDELIHYQASPAEVAGTIERATAERKAV